MHLRLVRLLPQSAELGTTDCLSEPLIAIVLNTMGLCLDILG
jgi:hypothetical protein